MNMYLTLPECAQGLEGIAIRTYQANDITSQVTCYN